MNSKLTIADVRRIRARYAEGVLTQPELARQFNVAPLTVHNIVTHKTHTEVEPGLEEIAAQRGRVSRERARLRQERERLHQAEQEIQKAELELQETERKLNEDEVRAQKRERLNEYVRTLAKT